MDYEEMQELIEKQTLANAKQQNPEVFERYAKFAKQIDADHKPAMERQKKNIRFNNIIYLIFAVAMVFLVVFGKYFF